MSKDDICSNCNLEICRNDIFSGSLNGECNNCNSCCEDGEDDVMNVFNSAEIWFFNNKDEDYMFGYTREELEDWIDD